MYGTWAISMLNDEQKIFAWVMNHPNVIDSPLVKPSNVSNNTRTMTVKGVVKGQQHIRQTDRRRTLFHRMPILRLRVYTVSDSVVVVTV